MSLWIIFFSLLVGFRGIEVGTDTISYVRMYDDLRSGYTGYPEPLFGLLGVLCNEFDFSFQIFQSILFYFAFSVAILAVIKRSPNYNFSVFFLFTCYFILYSLNIYRQMLACFISVFICNMYFERRCRVVTYLLLVGMVSLIHYTALLLIPLVFIDKLKMNKKTVIIGWGSSLLLGVMDISNILILVIGKYERLMLNDLYIRTVDKLFVGLLVSLYWTLLFLFIYRNATKEFKDSYYMKFFLCGLIIYNLLIWQDMGLRVLLYFTIHLSIALPLFLQLNFKKELLYKNLLVAYFSIYFAVFLLMNSADVVPYLLSW